MNSGRFVQVVDSNLNRSVYLFARESRRSGATAVETLGRQSGQRRFLMRPITGIAASLICMASSISSAATYPDGFTWQRSSDHTPGTVQGSVLGNPNLDSEGSVVWQMGWVGYGNLLGQSNPYSHAKRSRRDLVQPATYRMDAW
jgi:hypothetical protein